MREIILDTETTGFGVEEHRIVEIGCVEMVSRILTGRTFHVYLNPEREIDWTATRVHGITNEKVANEPKFAEVAAAFVDFIGDSPIVAHNAQFDAGFLNMELSRAGFAKMSNEIIDSLALARQKLPGQRAGLDALCRFYNIDLSARTFHGALLDAQLLADVYVELTGGLQGNLLGGESTATAATAVAITKTTSTTLISGKVITPTEAERETHQNFLKKQVKGALWLAENPD